MTRSTRRALGASILAFALLGALGPSVAYAASDQSRQTPSPVIEAAASSPKTTAAASSLASLAGKPAVTRARAGEGVIAITSRVCGSAAAWRSVAAANRIAAPRYLVLLGQRLTVSCSSRPAPHKATASPSGSTQAASTSGATWRAPLAHWSLTSCYGPRWGSFHRGLDMAAPSGTPIRAVHAGIISRAGWVWNGYGISVVVKHGDGSWSHYAHMSREVVNVGQRVSAGQTIGYVGSTGQSTGPHLHLEIARSSAVLGAQINPAPFLRARGIRIGC